MCFCVKGRRDNLECDAICIDEEWEESYTSASASRGLWPWLELEEEVWGLRLQGDDCAGTTGGAGDTRSWSPTCVLRVSYVSAGPSGVLGASWTRTSSRGRSWWTAARCRRWWWG